MAQVPYSPVPDVAPQDIPAPGFHPSVPPEAFGTNIAQAVQHLGSTVGQVGDELWNRAVSIQEMNNETASTKATADLELAARKRALDFTTNQLGLNAGQALPGEMQAQNDLREQYRAGLNPAAARMYDRYSLRIMNGELGNIAAHAARESHAAAVSERKNALEVIYDGVMQNPTPDNLSDGFARAGETMRGMAAQEGWSPEVAARKEMEIKSGLKEHFIEGLSHTDPQKANAYFEANRSTMTYEDIKRLENLIPARNRQVGTRIASDALHENWQPYMTSGQRRVMDGVASPLTQIVQEAQRQLYKEGKEFVPISGYRSNAEQRDIWGRSHGGRLFAAAPPGASRHEAGLAVDLEPQGDTSYGDIQRAMYAASAKLGIPLSGEHARLGARDRPHYSLPRDYDVGSAPAPQKIGLQEQVDTSRRFAARNYPNDPSFPDELEQRVRGNFHAADQINRQTIQDAMDRLQDGLYDRGDKQPPRNLDELLADPGRQQAMDTLRSLDPGKANSWPARITQYNRASSVHTGVEGQNLLTQWNGMRRGTSEDQAELLKIDPTDYADQLAQTDIRRVQDWQATVRKGNRAIDPNVAKALSSPLLQGMLRDPNVNIAKTTDPNRYYQFVGALGEALDSEMAAKGGKPLTMKETDEVGKRLLSGGATIERGWWNPMRAWSGDTYYQPQPTFEAYSRMDSKAKQELKEDWMNKHPGEVPTERQLAIEAASKAYNDTFGKKKEQ